MSLETAFEQLRLAKQTPFRTVFRPFVGSDAVPTLDDKASALVFHVSRDRVLTPAEIMSKLPVSLKAPFQELQEMRARGRPFFERFALFAKSENDGMLVGFGTDDLYYVLMVWDEHGTDFWRP